jgi:hypothetical protein
LAVPTEELQSIASILAAGYLRYRRRIRRKDSLDNPATSSPHGHEVNPFSANRCSSSTILEAPTLQALQLGSENPEKRL